MLIPILLFALGLILLIKGGDWFVDGATGIARVFNLPELLIGATVVSIGTTLPEVMVSATSAVSGHGEIAYGNAIGSIICNTSLIAALTIAIKPSVVDKKTLRTPVIFFFVAAILYATVAYTTGYFGRPVGIILLVLFVIYMIVTVRNAMRSPDRMQKLAQQEAELEFDEAEAVAFSDISPDDVREGDKQSRLNNTMKDVVLLIIGAALIAIGANLLVDNGTLIAKGFGVPESVIALTFVALGTSLPELVTAITSLVKGHGALSLGNIIGANIFNLVLVSGLSTTLSPFEVPGSKLIGGMNASLVMDIPVMLVVMAILTLPAVFRGKLTRVQGVGLLGIYTAFCVIQFVV